MNTLTIFYLENCPYCRYARRALGELEEERPEYKAVMREWIEESRFPGYAGEKGYDYWYVPSIFCGDKKLYEADPAQDYDSVKQSVRAALDAALAG